MVVGSGLGQNNTELSEAYRRSCRLALREQFDDARRLYLRIEATANPRLKSTIANDLAVLAAISGDIDASRTALEELLAGDSGCELTVCAR